MGCLKHNLRHRESGLSLLQHQTQRLTRTPWKERFVSGLDPHVVPDGWQSLSDPEEFQGHGPLAGILAGLQSSSTKQTIFLAVDYPNFPPEFLQEASRQRPESDWITFLDQSGQAQWLCSVVSHTMEPKIRENLRNGRRSVKYLAEEIEVSRFPLPESRARHALVNLNSQEDLGEWEMPSKFHPPRP